MKFKKDFQSIKDTFNKENDKNEDLRKILQNLEKKGLKQKVQQKIVIHSLL